MFEHRLRREYVRRLQSSWSIQRAGKAKTGRWGEGVKLAYKAAKKILAAWRKYPTLCVRQHTSVPKC